MKGRSLRCRYDDDPPFLSPRVDRSSKPPRAAPKTAVNEGGQVPKLFVGIAPQRSYMSMRYALARIVIKRGCYRYLVWKDGGKKREFYLGKLKILAPPAGSCSSPATSHQVARSRKGRGGRK